MSVKLKKKRKEMSITALLGMRGGKITVFKNGYHFNDLFTIKHNYESINKIKSRKNKNP